MNSSVTLPLCYGSAGSITVSKIHAHIQNKFSTEFFSGADISTALAWQLMVTDADGKVEIRGD